jgi:hypothetical protein
MNCSKCGSPIERPAGPGRPAAYCSDVCKRLVEYELRRIDRRLAQYELEQRELKADGVDEWEEDEAKRQRRLRALRTWIRTDEARLRELLGGGTSGHTGHDQSTPERQTS